MGSAGIWLKKQGKGGGGGGGGGVKMNIYWRERLAYNRVAYVPDWFAGEGN